MVDITILLPLLVALVPLALFFALVRRRPTPPAAREASPREATPPADFGLERDPPAPAAADDSAPANAGAAAAAAGGALLLGYGASRADAADEGVDTGSDGAGDGGDGR